MLISIFIYIYSIICTMNNLVNTESECYLPDGCRFVNDGFEHILCTDLYATFDYQKFNESLDQCSKKNSLRIGGLYITIKPKLKHNIIDISKIQLTSLMSYGLDVSISFVDIEGINLEHSIKNI